MQQEAKSFTLSGSTLFNDLVRDAEWAGLILVVLAGVLVLIAIALVIARTLSSVAHQTLKLVGQTQWADGLTRRRVFRNIGFALPLLIVLGNLPPMHIDTRLAAILLPCC